MADLTVNFSATLTGANANVGQVLVHLSDGTYTVANTTTLSSYRPYGIAVSAATIGQAVAIQYTGEISNTVSGLSVGSKQPVKVSSSGTLERVASPVPSDHVVGEADVNGNVLLCFVPTNVVPLSTINIGTGNLTSLGSAYQVLAVNAAATGLQYQNITNNHVSSDTADRISGLKITPNFGSQTISSTAAVNCASMNVTGTILTGNVSASASVLGTNATFTTNVAAGNVAVTTNVSAGNVSVTTNVATGNASVTTNVAAGNVAVTTATSTGALSVSGNATVTGFVGMGINAAMRTNVAGASEVSFTSPYVYYAAAGGAEALRITPSATGATILSTVAGVTSMAITVSNTASNGVTGVPINVAPQNCSGTTTTGGSVNLIPGLGTSEYGVVSVRGALAGRVTTLSGMTDAGYTVSADEGNATIILVPSSLTLGAQRNITVPAREGWVFIVKNSTTGGFAVNVQTNGGSGIVVANGKTAILWCDGTNINRATADV